MKSNYLVLTILIGIMLAFAFKVNAATLSMKTTYPAPSGFYKTLTVSDKLIIPCHNASHVSSQLGEVWVVDTLCGP